MSMKNSKAAVLRHVGTSGKSNFNSGVRQRDGLSAMLFNIALVGIMRDCNIKGSLKEKSVQVIEFSDDLVIIARGRNSLEETLLI